MKTDPNRLLQWPRILPRLQAALSALLLCSGALSARSDSSDQLIDLLIKKGVITQEEARELRDSMEADEAAAEDDSRELPPAKETPPEDFPVYWDQGLRFESDDRETFQGRFGGRIMWDVAAFAEDSDIRALPRDVDRTPPGTVGNIPAATEFRRARLFTSGEFDYGLPISYKLQLDFAGAGVALKDAYVGLEDLPYVGRVRLGHFKGSFSLEELTSSKYITFMERAAPLDAFAPGRNTGIQLDQHALDRRITWAAGVFAETDDSGDGEINGNHTVTARLTGLPYYESQPTGERLLHLGVSSYLNNPPEDESRFRARPEAHLAPRFVDTGTFDADMVYRLDPELALVWGPFSLQGEYIRTWVDAQGRSNPVFDGYYVFGSWFLTGEQRPYDRTSGSFGRVIPKDPFSPTEGGLGAWEVGIRYSSLDLDDAGIRGGEMDTLTLGLNWHLHPQARLMLNYGLSQVDRGGLNGDAHSVQSRVQVDF